MRVRAHVYTHGERYDRRNYKRWFLIPRLPAYITNNAQRAAHSSQSPKFGDFHGLHGIRRLKRKRKERKREKRRDTFTLACVSVCVRGGRGDAYVEDYDSIAGAFRLAPRARIPSDPRIFSATTTTTTATGTRGASGFNARRFARSSGP